MGRDRSTLKANITSSSSQALPNSQRINRIEPWWVSFSLAYLPTSIHDLLACFATRRTGQKFLDWRGVCLAQLESSWRTVCIHGLVSMFCLRKSTTRSAKLSQPPSLTPSPGTAGFRAKAHLLPSTFLRMGFLAALRSQQTGQVCVLHPSLTQRRICTTGCCQLVGTFVTWMRRSVPIRWHDLLYSRAFPSCLSSRSWE